MTCTHFAIRSCDGHIASRRAEEWWLAQRTAAKEWWLAMRGAATVWWRARASPGMAEYTAAAGRLLARARDLTLVGLPAFVAAAAVVATTVQAGSLGYLPFAGTSFVLAALAWKACMRTLDSWRARRPPARTQQDDDDVETAGSFSVTVPAHPDKAKLEATVWQLVTGDDRPSEVVIAVGTDDPATREIADRLARRYRPLVNMVVQAGGTSPAMSGEPLGAGGPPPG